MAESTCLHIQDHDAGPIRIVEIPWISARIGRAAFCEVRLTDPSLPEEACRLHRRGRTWHLTPLHGSDVTVDGEAVEAPRTLPYDASFQVGPFRLALRRGKFAEPDWRPEADALRTLRAEPAPLVEPPTPPLTNPWEARWRDAGDRLKAARAADARVAPAPPAPPAAPPTPPPAAERPAPRDVPRPAVSPRVETPAPAPAPAPPRPRPAATRYEPRAYARPTPPTPRRSAPAPSTTTTPPASQPWTRPVRRPAEVPTPRSWTNPAPAVAPKPKPAPEPTPAPEPPAPPVSTSRRFHFLDAEAIARLEAPDEVESFQAVPEPPKPRAIRRRLRRTLVERPAGDVSDREPDAPEAPAAVVDTGLLALAHQPSPLEEAVREPDEGPTAASSFESDDFEIPVAGPQPPEPAPSDLDGSTPTLHERSESPLPPGEWSRDAEGTSARENVDPGLSQPTQGSSPGPSGQYCSARDLDVPETSPLPPGEGSRAAAGEGRRSAEGTSAREDVDPGLSQPTRRPSPGPSGHPLPAGEGTSSLPRASRAEQDRPPSVEVEVEFDATAYEPEAPSSWSFPAGPFVADTNVFGFGSGPVDFEASRPRRAVPRVAEAEEEAEAFDPTRARRSSGEDAWVLPSVQDVLNNGLRRARAEAGSIPRPASRPSPATPTLAVEPAHWSPPAWLATPPALAATLAVGALLAFCSWRQAKVSHDAAAVIQASASVRLAGAAAKDRPLPPGLVPPAPSWWGAAPAHLAEWGVYLDGTKVDHGLNATAAGMFEAAAAVGPLDPLARLALARKRGEASPAPGLSRDAVALAWTGRTLHRAGKDAEAVRAYRRALEVAAHAEPPRGAPLAYSEDPNVPRYLLPGEDLAAAVVGELTADASWSYRDWAEAVPETGVSALAAARALRKENRPEADTILRRIIERADAAAKAAPAGDPGRIDADDDDEAVTLAVAAEAMALRADWKAAAGRYRAAIDRMADPRVRRSWWFNLADVAMHSNDVDQRRAALDEALASTSSDEVSRRVLELRHAGETASRLRSNGTKAN